jgi:hypothetical protein
MEYTATVERLVVEGSDHSEHKKHLFGSMNIARDSDRDVEMNALSDDRGIVWLVASKANRFLWKRQL